MSSVKMLPKSLKTFGTYEAKFKFFPINKNDGAYLNVITVVKENQFSYLYPSLRNEFPEGHAFILAE